MKATLLAIVNTLKARGENSEVALFHVNGKWHAEACNPVPTAIGLGEAIGRYQSHNLVDSDTTDPETALAKLLDNVVNGVTI